MSLSRVLNIWRRQDQTAGDKSLFLIAAIVYMMQFYNPLAISVSDGAEYKQHKPEIKIYIYHNLMESRIQLDNYR